MYSFKQFLQEHLSHLQEKIITLGKVLYPKFNTIVLLAGGGGSGKGFILSNLIGVEGKVLDVDALKELSINTPKIKKLLSDEMLDVDYLNFKNPNDVFALHTALEKLDIINKHQKNIFKSVMSAEPTRKPNLIFDVTLKTLKKFNDILFTVKELGYTPENIHLVWVVNDIEIARAQNLNRSRTVPDDILFNTHEGASITMKEIITICNDISNKFDGDIVLAFNKKGVDVNLIANKNNSGFYIKDANYFYIKKSGKLLDADKLTNEIIEKIKSYVPNSEVWD